MARWTPPALEGSAATGEAGPARAVAGEAAVGRVGGELRPIGALARAAGVSTRTVRYYEEIGLLRTARRFAGGRRVFDGDALERLHFIGRLKRLGFTLEEIGELNDVFTLQRSTRAMLDVLDGKLGQHLGALEEQLRELSRLRTDLDAYRAHVRTRLADLADPARAGAPHSAGAGATAGATAGAAAAGSRAGD